MDIESFAFGLVAGVALAGVVESLVLKFGKGRITWGGGTSDSSQGGE